MISNFSPPKLSITFLCFQIHQTDLPTSGLYSGHEMNNYLAQDDDFGGPRAVKDTKSIGSAYDRYLQNGVTSLSI